MTTLGQPAIIASVVRQHAEEAAFLFTLRMALATAPQARLRHLGGFDERIVAHLDGLSVAGEGGWRFCEAGLATGSAGAAFAATVRSLEEKRQDRLDRLFALAAVDPDVRSGLTSAFGWVERERLRGTVAALLRSDDPLRRTVGIAACALHGVDPGDALAAALREADPVLRASALKTAGDIGRQDLSGVCLAAAEADEDAGCRFWGARSAVLFGDRGKALGALMRVATGDDPRRAPAFQLLVQTMGLKAHALLTRLAKDSSQVRWLIEGSGLVGDPAYVPWLIGQMRDDAVSRLAGEAFSLVTGADLAQAHLERKAPAGFEAGPNDDPEDPNVDMDPDEGLPWPDAPGTERWWAENGSRFATGRRYFLGAPITREHCANVLKTGYQRQRILAAHYLCLLGPSTPLFNTSAPAWRQQTLLARM